MRKFPLLVLPVLIFGLCSCAREDRSRREPAAHQAGREAYHASQELKRDARDAAHDLRSAGKEFRQGWSEAKHDEPTTRRK